MTTSTLASASGSPAPSRATANDRDAPVAGEMEHRARPVEAYDGHLGPLGQLAACHGDRRRCSVATADVEHGRRRAGLAAVLAKSTACSSALSDPELKGVRGSS